MPLERRIDRPFSQQRADPLVEAVDVDRPRVAQRHTGDRIIVLMCVLAQEVRLNGQDAVQVEGASIQNIRWRYRTTLGAVDDRGRVDRTQPRLQGRQLVRRNQIRLVKQDDVCKGNLFRRLVTVVEPCHHVLGVDDGDDRNQAWRPSAPRRRQRRFARPAPGPRAPWSRSG